MKSQFQTLSFLSNYTPKTPLDSEFIDSFLAKRFKTSPRTLRNAPNFDANPLDVSFFIQWFESGVEALKIALHESTPVILGNCTLQTCEIIGSLNSDGTIDTEVKSVPSSEIRSASEEVVRSFQSSLLRNNLQPDPATLRLIPKYTPGLGHRVIFYDFSLELQGVGVVRDITAEGDVIFFCYFTYPTQTLEKQIGYSLWENPGFNLRSVIFENIDKENKPTILGNSTSCFRRLGRELERVGKVWKDKTLRIEPLQMKLDPGQTYYYITDKMKVVVDTEKGTPTSHKRYLAGNYFTSHKAAVEMLGKFQIMLRNYLASEQWPEMGD